MDKLLKIWDATIRHDKGTITIRTYAPNKESAIMSICNFELCPESAIIDIKESKS